MRAIRATLAVRNHVGMDSFLLLSLLVLIFCLRAEITQRFKAGRICWRKRLFNRNAVSNVRPTGLLQTRHSKAVFPPSIGPSTNKDAELYHSLA
jgi:hypothetical protein